MNQAITFPSGIPEGKYDHLIVHAMATPPSMADADALWVDRSHRRRGWSGNGYHAVITRASELQHETTGHRTRPYKRTGAHVGGCGPGWNERCLGISMAGGVKEDGRTPEDNFTTGQLEVLAQYIAAAMAHFNIPRENVIGHRDLIKRTNAAPKACPCFSVQTWMRGMVEDGTRRNFAPSAAAMADRDKTLRVHKTYTVQDGDTLWGISNATGVPLHSLEGLNKLTSDLIIPGQKLRLRH